MKTLFSPEGRAALARMMARRPLVAFDFDGTLAPIVPIPARAKVPSAVAHRLATLAARCDVAVITGRSVADVTDRLPFMPWRVIGNHGAESCVPGEREMAVQALDVARQHLARWHPALAGHGVDIEDKGASIAVHYRLAADRRAALEGISQALAELPQGLAIFGGKMVANIVPEWATDKAGALERLTSERPVPYAVFLGDDVNDECVFVREHPHWLTIRVGHDYPNSRAQFVVDSTSDLPVLLDLMVAGLPEG